MAGLGLLVHGSTTHRAGPKRAKPTYRAVRHKAQQHRVDLHVLPPPPTLHATGAQHCMLPPPKLTTLHATGAQLLLVPRLLLSVPRRLVLVCVLVLVLRLLHPRHHGQDALQHVLVKAVQCGTKVTCAEREEEET